MSSGDAGTPGVIAHRPGSWFLLRDPGDRRLLDVRCDQGPVTGSVLIELDAEEAAAWRSGGVAAIDDLARRIADSAPLARASSSAYRSRDLSATEAARTDPAVLDFLRRARSGAGPDHDRGAPAREARAEPRPTRTGDPSTQETPMTDPVAPSDVVAALRRPVAPPPAAIAAQARERLAALATPPGALGGVGELAVWWAACTGRPAPDAPQAVRLVIFAGDHGVAGSGVSAFPPAITGAMVRTFLSGRGGVNVLARRHDVAVRVLDLAVDEDLPDLDPEVRARVQQYKVRRASGSIERQDALTREEAERAIAAGAAVAAEEIAAGADLLLSGDMGIGNTTPAAALVAAALGLDPAEAATVTGRGTGIDDAALAHKAAVVRAALERTRARWHDPVDTLAALGSADLAAAAGYLAAAAHAGIPVLLDGLMSVACAVSAERLAPGCAAWFAAGHRSPEPAQRLALDHLGLVPLLDLGMRLGEGSGAVVAVPLVRSAADLLRDVALLSDLG